MEHPYDDAEVKKHLKMIAKSNKWKQIILRGCILGLFNGVGTIAGFILIGFLFINIIGSLKQLPLIDSILQQTKLDVLIESQVNRLTQEQGNSSSSSTSDQSAQTNTTPTETTLTYSDTTLGINFSYPSSFTSVKEIAGENELGKIIQLNSGDGALHNLDIYVDQDIQISGASMQRFIPKNDMDRIVLHTYENGAVINSTNYDNAVFYAEVPHDNHTFEFIGLATPETPKLAREVFTQILESLSFNGN
jgi:hypothetical protein